MYKKSYIALLLIASTAHAEEVVDRVVAVIENSVVTERELDDKAKFGMTALQDISEPAAREKRRKEILKQALDEMVSEKLIESELAKMRDKFGITDAQVEKAFEETARTNHMDKDTLTQALYNQGMTVAEFKQRLRRELERSQYLQFRMQGKTGFTEKDVLARCAEYKAQQAAEWTVRARHILVRVAPEATAAEAETARKKAQAIYERIAKGAKFVDMVAKESDDKGTPGGDLGYFKKGEMMPPFEAVAFSQNIGVVSKPVRTTMGYHLVLVEDKKRVEATGCEDEQVKAQVSNELYSRELARQMKLWVDELRRKAFVEIKI